MRIRAQAAVYDAATDDSGHPVPGVRVCAATTADPDGVQVIPFAVDGKPFFLAVNLAVLPEADPASE